MIDKEESNMMLAWNDAQSFRKHLEQMNIFRRNHTAIKRDSVARLMSMPALMPRQHPGQSGGMRCSAYRLKDTARIPLQGLFREKVDWN
jgi:hypothetical protein